MQIKMISKRDINKLYMGKIISAVFENVQNKSQKFWFDVAKRQIRVGHI